MHFTTTLLLSLAATVFARPQGAVPAGAADGSKKNVYLATCTTRGLLGSDTASVVIYFNGPSNRVNPADVASVSEPPRRWDGAIRRASLNAGWFTSRIASGADELPKSQMAGSATLGTEDLVCFVDGTSTFRLSSGLLGLGSTNCKADFWCASLEVGTV